MWQLRSMLAYAPNTSARARELVMRHAPASRPPHYTAKRNDGEGFSPIVD
jgi:hypothetical protein